MNVPLYMPFIYLGIFSLIAIAVLGAIFYWLGEKSRKVDDE